MILDVNRVSEAVRGGVEPRRRRWGGAQVRDRVGRALEIGEFEPRDWESVLATYRSLSPAQRPPALPLFTEERLAVWVDALWRSGPNLVARLGRRVVGHAALVDCGARSYELVAVAHAEHQGVGVGGALVDAALSLAGRQGAERVWLRVGGGNHWAVSLCRRLGFRPESVDESGRETWVLVSRRPEPGRRRWSRALPLTTRAARGAARVWLRAEAVASEVVTRALFPAPAAAPSPTVPARRSETGEAGCA